MKSLEEHYRELRQLEEQCEDYTEAENYLRNTSEPEAAAIMTFMKSVVRHQIDRKIEEINRIKGT